MYIFINVIQIHSKKRGKSKRGESKRGKSKRGKSKRGKSKRGKSKRGESKRGNIKRNKFQAVIRFLLPLRIGTVFEAHLDVGPKWLHKTQQVSSGNKVLITASNWHRF